MDGWKLLGKDSGEEQEKRLQEMRLGEPGERSLLLHEGEGIIYELGEYPAPDGRADQYICTLRPLAGIEKRQDEIAQSRKGSEWASDPLDRYPTEDAELARHVNALRRAEAVRPLLAEFEFHGGRWRDTSA